MLNQEKELTREQRGLLVAQKLDLQQVVEGITATSKKTPDRPERKREIKSYLIEARSSRSVPAIGKNPVLTLLQIVCDAEYLPRGELHQPLGRNPGLIDQAQDKIKALEDLIQPIGDLTERHEEPKFNQPWFYIGPKKAVPKCACYVGHYCYCGCDCYVWVAPDNMKTLRDFTLAILSLAPPDKQDLSSVLLRGAAVGPPASLR